MTNENDDPTEMSNSQLAARLREESQVNLFHWNYSQLDLVCEALARILGVIEMESEEARKKAKEEK